MDQLHQLLEREAITKVMYDYCRAVDTGDVERFVALFADDGVANYSVRDLNGHDELRAFFTKFIGEIMEATQHQVSNIDIEFDDDDHARASSYVTAWHRFNEPRPDYVVHGEYVDTWRRDDGTWKLVTRNINVQGEVHQPR